MADRYARAACLLRSETFWSMSAGAHNAAWAVARRQGIPADVLTPAVCGEIADAVIDVIRRRVTAALDDA